jgi:hypothetical protein
MSILNNGIFALVDLFCVLRHPVLMAHYVARTKRYPRVAYPRNVNEKFLWRKIFDHDPRFVILSDKLACKEWIAERWPNVRIPCSVWASRRPDDLYDVPNSLFDRPLVFKPNHSSRRTIFLQPEPPDRDRLVAMAQFWLKKHHGRRQYEWSYFDIPRQVFLEERIIPRNGNLSELKLYTFGEKVERIIHLDGPVSARRANSWILNSEGVISPSPEPATVAPADPALVLPDAWPDAVALASKIGSLFDHLRVDLYWDGEEWWVGEMTVYSLAGYFMAASGFDPNSSLMHSWDLRRSWFLRTPKLSGWRWYYRQALLDVLPPST